MEENKFNTVRGNEAEDTAVSANPAEPAITAATETAAAMAAHWHKENDMGQFVREEPYNIEQFMCEDPLSEKQTLPDSESAETLPIKPLMWEDTPLFSFIGRYGSPESDARQNPENQPAAGQNMAEQAEETLHNNEINNLQFFCNLQEESNPQFYNTQEESNPQFRNLQEESNLQFRNIQEVNTTIPEPRRDDDTRRAEPFNVQEFVLDGLSMPGTLYRESSPFDQTYKFVNAPLPYNYDALEPYIDKLTMQLHHDKHLQKYIDELNAALASHPRYHGWRLERLLQSADMLPAQIRTAVINNGGGVYNHFFYFESLTPNPELKIMPPALNALLTSAFKSVADFKAEFKKKALSVFGSGYAWLVLNPGGKPEITTTANQDTPLAKKQYPLLNIDVWEHAYYLKHHNMRDAYVDSWFKAVNWREVEKRLTEIRI